MLTGTKERKKKKDKKNVPNLTIAFGPPSETFLSNKLAARVVSKIVLIVFVL